MKKEITIDGKNFDTLDGFYEEFTRSVDPEMSWGHNFDAFNDVLRGGMGTPDGGFIFVWKNSEKSKEDLGYAETVKWVEKKLKQCHPSNIENVKSDLEMAKNGEGQTVYEILVEIINVHGLGGSEAEDGVELDLK